MDMVRVGKPSTEAELRLTIREVAATTGITTHTLRYYERIGLLQPVARAASGHRRYGEADLRWLDFVKKVHATGMSIRKMLEYARLARKGETTVAARRALLEAHRLTVKEKLAQLQSTLGVIEHKLTLYDRALEDGREATYVAATRLRTQSQ
jgi:DNA-binding transcriptional MerR regulator